jgi:hypothetical protein
MELSPEPKEDRTQALVFMFEVARLMRRIVEDVALARRLPG